MKDDKTPSFSGMQIFKLVLFGILLTVLVGSIIRIINGGTSFTFTTLLETITNVPQIPFTTLQTISIVGDWGLFDFFRNFLNFFVMPFNIIIFVSANLWNCLLYVIYFVKFLFFV